MIRVALLALPLLITSCASGEYAERQRQSEASSLARLIDDRVAGAPQDCLDSKMTNGFEPVSASTIVYFQGDTLYRNDLIGQCQGLRRDDILITESTTGRLCRGDFARTASRTGGMMTGACALGQFVPYRRPR